MRTAIILSLVSLIAFSCQYYSVGDPSDLPEAQSCLEMSDCNAGRTCGELKRCIDNLCSTEQVLVMRCSEGRCQDDYDCPAGTHCEIYCTNSDCSGTCFYDDCTETADCQHLPVEPGCSDGAYVCRDGRCVLTCS